MNKLINYYWWLHALFLPKREYFFQKAGNRVAVHFPSLRLPICKKMAIEILEKSGFRLITPFGASVLSHGFMFDCIHSSKYKRGSRLSEAPKYFDCSSFVKWVYGHMGIWLPRRSIQQAACGYEVPLCRVESGDLVFTSGHIDYYENDPQQGIGHVGIISVFTKNFYSVFHAANSRDNVTVSSLNGFIYGKNGESKFRCCRRILPPTEEFFVVECPPEREVETSDDIKWIIYQSL